MHVLTQSGHSHVKRNKKGSPEPAVGSAVRSGAVRSCYIVLIVELGLL